MPNAGTHLNHTVTEYLDSLCECLTPIGVFQDLGIANQAEATIRCRLKSETGVGYLDVTSIGDDFRVIISNRTSFRDYTISMAGDDWISFHVRLSGRTFHNLAGAEKERRDADNLSMTIHPRDVTRLEYCPPNEQISFVALAIKPSYVQKLDITDFAGYPSALKSFTERGEGNFIHKTTPLSNSVAAAARGIMDHSFCGKIGWRYLGAKATELFCLSLASFDESVTNKKNPHVLLTPSDHDKLRALKDHIDKNYGDVADLESLGRIFAINRNKICYGFKSMFHHTLFEYCRIKQLEYARNLLRDTSIAIIEVAAAAGYENPSSFARAFRAQYGISPRNIRKHRN